MQFMLRRRASVSYSHTADYAVLVRCGHLFFARGDGDGDGGGRTEESARGTPAVFTHDGDGACHAAPSTANMRESESECEQTGCLAGCGAMT